VHLAALGEVSSALLPALPVLVAEVDGELRAAVSLLDRVEQERPVRLLGVRLEMVEPEGGY